MEITTRIFKKAEKLGRNQIITALDEGMVDLRQSEERRQSKQLMFWGKRKEDPGFGVGME